jgi:hypothetical protein
MVKWEELLGRFKVGLQYIMLLFLLGIAEEIRQDSHVGGT